jgi:hypothetical protein
MLHDELMLYYGHVWDKTCQVAQQRGQLGELIPTLGLSFFLVKFFLEIVHR